MYAYSAIFQGKKRLEVTYKTNIIKYLKIRMKKKVTQE